MEMSKTSHSGQHGFLVVLASGILALGVVACAGDDAGVLEYNSPPGQEGTDATDVPAEADPVAPPAVGDQSGPPPGQVAPGADPETLPTDPGVGPDGSPPADGDSNVDGGEPSDPIVGATDPIAGPTDGGRSSGLDTTF